MKKGVLILVFALLFAGLAFADSCRDDCQAEYDRHIADAEALAAAKGYYLGYADSNCGNVLENRAGKADTCAVNLNSCQATSDYATCNDQYQTCCLASARSNANVYLNECLAGCPTCDSSSCPEDYCLGGVAYTYECEPDTGNCVQSDEICDYGCDSSGTGCAAGDRCANVDCSRPQCQGSYSVSGGYCSRATGECMYTYSEQCSYGCDASTGECKQQAPPKPPSQPPTQQGPDICAGVSCPDRCVNGVMYYDGKCDPADGRCGYDSYANCPGACDAAGDACAQAAGSIAGEVYITDFSYQNPQLAKMPLKNVKLDFSFYDSSGKPINFFGNAPNVWTDESGRFTLSHQTALAAGNTMDIMVSFKDNDKKLELRPPGGRSYASKYVVRGISVTDPSLSDYQIDLTDLGTTGERDADSYGKVYVNTLRAVGFKERALGLTPTKKEVVWMYSSHGTSHLGEQYSDPDTGMRINIDDSGFFSSDAPDNREFHEYCHHIENEAKPIQYSKAGDDHGSYNGNSNTEWGMAEGWAEFCSLQAKKYYGLGSNGLYYYSGGVINFEMNHKVDANPDDKFNEELGLGGIILDLADSAADYGGKDDDSVSLPLTTVWSAFSGQRDFGDGKGLRYPRSLYDFYVGIKALAATSSGIDSIFIAHNAFQDLNSNGKWDSGEPAGYSGKGSTYRKDLEPQEGTAVVFDVKDQNGNSLTSGMVAHVEVRLDPPNDYLSYSYNIIVKNGKAYVPVPPEGYEGQVTMTAVQAGTAQTASTPFSITASDARAKLKSKTSFGTYEATITTVSVSCTSDFQCRALGAGSECSSGMCTGNADGEESCCGSAFVFAFIGAGVFAFSRR